MDEDEALLFVKDEVLMVLGPEQSWTKVEGGQSLQTVEGGQPRQTVEDTSTNAAGLLYHNGNHAIANKPSCLFITTLKLCLGGLHGRGVIVTCPSPLWVRIPAGYIESLM